MWGLGTHLGVLPVSSGWTVRRNFLWAIIVIDSDGGGTTQLLTSNYIKNQPRRKQDNEGK
jgi:hypothetical protein